MNDFITPFRLRKIGTTSNVRVLDVGCGDTLKATKHYRPQWELYGLDKKYGSDFRVDLNKDPRPGVGSYNIIILSHIIEHLQHPEEVLLHFMGRVRINGIMYLEYPSQKSVDLPSMSGTLNYYDDKTHIYLPNTEYLVSIFQKHGWSVEFGRRRDWLRILLMPIHVPMKFVYRGFRFRGSDFWDILGFADYILATKK